MWVGWLLRKAVWIRWAELIDANRIEKIKILRLEGRKQEKKNKKKKKGKKRKKVRYSFCSFFLLLLLLLLSFHAVGEIYYLFNFHVY